MSGIIIGTVFLNSPYSPVGVNDRVSFFAFTIMAFLFTSIEALPIFLDERQIYIRESSRGAYRTSSYVIAGQPKRIALPGPARLSWHRAGAVCCAVMLVASQCTDCQCCSH